MNIKIKLDQMIEILNLEAASLLKVAVNDNHAPHKKAIFLSNYLVQYLCCNHTLQLAIGKYILFKLLYRNIKSWGKVSKLAVPTEARHYFGAARNGVCY